MNMNYQKLFPFILLLVPVCLQAEPDDLLRSSGLAPQAEFATEESFPDLRTPPVNEQGDALSDINGILTLEDCIKIALANSPKAVSALLAAEEAQINVNLAKSEFLPTLTAGASQGYSVVKADSLPTSD
ncbi:MAG: TolC family protein, partial [Elusimicrobiaceae bacterium]|nr:TolC family protein [Elusimicrobiaceae bacterium]